MEFACVGIYDIAEACGGIAGLIFSSGPVVSIWDSGCLIAAAAGGGAYLSYSRKKEEQQRALRREQRRRRLREEGVTEEEFDRLLKERLGDCSKGNNRKKR